MSVLKTSLFELIFSNQALFTILCWWLNRHFDLVWHFMLRTSNLVFCTLRHFGWNTNLIFLTKNVGFIIQMGLIVSFWSPWDFCTLCKSTLSSQLRKMFSAANSQWGRKSVGNEKLLVNWHLTARSVKFLLKGIADAKCKSRFIRFADKTSNDIWSKRSFQAVFDCGRCNVCVPKTSHFRDWHRSVVNHFWLFSVAATLYKNSFTPKINIVQKMKFYKVDLQKIFLFRDFSL